MTQTTIKVYTYREDLLNYTIGDEVPVFSKRAYDAQPETLAELSVPVTHYTYFNERMATSNGYNRNVVGVIKRT